MTPEQFWRLHPVEFDGPAQAGVGHHAAHQGGGLLADLRRPRLHRPDLHRRPELAATAAQVTLIGAGIGTIVLSHMALEH